MNLLIVNIGSTCILKEPLMIFEGGTKLTCSTKDIRPQYQPIKPDLTVKPKFNYPQCKIINQQQETMNKIRTKTEILDKILNLYFGKSDYNEVFENQLITNIQADIIEQNQNEDFISFQKLISILSFETKDDYTFYSTMTTAQYENLTSYQRYFLINSISKVKYPILMEHIKIFAPNPSPVIQSNSGNEIKQQQPNSINKKDNKTFYDIQTEQNETFRRYVNNPELSEEQIKTYVNVCNGDILKGVDIYFQTIFKLSMLTLRYIYYNNEEIVHYFSFTAEVIELNNAVKEDRPFIDEFSLFTFNKKEIDIEGDPRRLVGTLDLINNSALIVKEEPRNLI